MCFLLLGWQSQLQLLQLFVLSGEHTSKKELAKDVELQLHHLLELGVICSSFELSCAGASLPHKLCWATTWLLPHHPADAASCILPPFLLLSAFGLLF